MFLALLLSASPVTTAQRSGPAKNKKLHVAARQGDLEALQAHIQKGTNLNQLDNYGYSALKCAMESSRPDVVKLLLDGGADANVKDGRGEPALTTAARRGQLEVVQMLLAKGADVNARDKRDATALLGAVQMRQQPVVEALVEAGADVNLEDSTGQSPLAVALRANNAGAAQYLRQQGAKEPVQRGPMSMYEDEYTQMTMQGPAGGGAAAVPQADLSFLEDPNAVMKKVASFGPLAAALQAVDANSQTEQRSWIQQRMDNRTTLLRSIEGQFGQEMTLLKGVATGEKAAKTVEAIDALNARREKRYEDLGDALREQRREAMRSQASSGRGRGRYSGRGGRGAYAEPTTDTGMNAYGPTATSARPRRGGEPNRPPMDPVTQQQIQTWLQAKPDDKSGLLDAVAELDRNELGNVHRIATEEEAKQTAVAIEGVLVARQRRIAKIQQEWQIYAERMQRLQERTDQRTGLRGRGRGMQNTQTQTNQPTSRRGRRYR